MAWERLLGGPWDPCTAGGRGAGRCVLAHQGSERCGCFIIALRVASEMKEADGREAPHPVTACRNCCVSTVGLHGRS